jgi:hypothetical protein
MPSLSRRALAFVWIYVLPLVLPWVILLVVNATSPAPAPGGSAGLPIRTEIPVERWRPDRCTWDCHNHGCRHAPVLPAVITDDRYVFGATIRGLYVLGSLFSRDRFAGYGMANIAVFCVAWPALMYALWVRAWRQREELQRLRAQAQAQVEERA